MGSVTACYPPKLPIHHQSLITDLMGSVSVCMLSTKTSYHECLIRLDGLWDCMLSATLYPPMFDHWLDGPCDCMLSTKTYLSWTFDHWLDGHCNCILSTKTYPPPPPPECLITNLMGTVTVRCPPKRTSHECLITDLMGSTVKLFSSQSNSSW